VPPGSPVQTKRKKVAMSQSEPTSRLPHRVEAGRTAKRPYQKPTVRHEQVFETTALTCGKVQTTQGSCHYNRKTS
jgi:hypothetical protein